MTRYELKYLSLIMLIFVAACIETDIYLPAFPDMMVFFNTSEEVIQSILTWNFVGLCISGPFYGPISDAYGRRRATLVALGLFLVGSLAAIMTNDFNTLLIGRILQGLGSGGCFTLGCAIIFDAFPEERAAIALNHLNTLIPLTMSAAPLVGGYLNYAYGFKANFWAIGIVVFAAFVSCWWFLPETLKPEERQPFQLKVIRKNIGTLFKDVRFWQSSGVISLLFAGYLAFLSGTSLLFVEELGVSKAHFPFYQGSLLFAYVCASLSCNWLMARFDAVRVRWFGASLVVVGGLLLTLGLCVFPRDPVLLTLFMTPYVFGFMYVQTPYFVDFMNFYPQMRGIASSLLTSLRLLYTAAVIALASYAYDGTALPIAGAVIGIVMMVVPIVLCYERALYKASPQK